MLNLFLNSNSKKILSLSKFINAMLRPYFLFLILLMAATAFAQTDSIPTENSGKVAVIVELGKETKNKQNQSQKDKRQSR